jgi:hypothetical protein
MGIVLALCLAGHTAVAQTTPLWQKEMDEARRSAANGENTAIVVRPNSKLQADWAVGVHVFYNAPRPFCYAYVVPGEWLPVPGKGGLLRSREGRALVNVNFIPPRRLESVEGETILERGRKTAVRDLERALGQPLVDASLVPFESARMGAWRLTAAPISRRDGQKLPLPLHIIVDLQPHTVAEVNVVDSDADEDLARQIVSSLRTTTEPGCYSSDMERMFRAAYGER